MSSLQVEDVQDNSSIEKPKTHAQFWKELGQITDEINLFDVKFNVVHQEAQGVTEFANELTVVANKVNDHIRKMSEKQADLIASVNLLRTSANHHLQTPTLKNTETQTDDWLSAVPLVQTQSEVATEPPCDVPKKAVTEELVEQSPERSVSATEPPSNVPEKAVEEEMVEQSPKRSVSLEKTKKTKTVVKSPEKELEKPVSIDPSTSFEQESKENRPPTMNYAKSVRKNIPSSSGPFVTNQDSEKVWPLMSSVENCQKSSWNELSGRSNSKSLGDNQWFKPKKVFKLEVSQKSSQMGLNKPSLIDEKPRKSGWLAKTTRKTEPDVVLEADSCKSSHVAEQERISPPNEENDNAHGDESHENFGKEKDVQDASRDAQDAPDDQDPTDESTPETHKSVDPAIDIAKKKAAAQLKKELKEQQEKEKKERRNKKRAEKLAAEADKRKEEAEERQKLEKFVSISIEYLEATEEPKINGYFDTEIAKTFLGDRIHYYKRINDPEFVLFYTVLLEKLCEPLLRLIHKVFSARNSATKLGVLEKELLNDIKFNSDQRVLRVEAENAIRYVDEFVPVYIAIQEGFRFENRTIPEKLLGEEKFINFHSRWLSADHNAFDPEKAKQVFTNFAQYQEGRKSRFSMYPAILYKKMLDSESPVLIADGCMLADKIAAGETEREVDSYYRNMITAVNKWRLAEEASESV